MDRHWDSDSERERVRRALESMAWVRDRHPPAPPEDDAVDDGPLVIHTVSDSDQPG